MSRAFILTLLGTCTNYAKKFGAPYVRGETLSVIHDVIVGQTISSDPNNRPTSAISAVSSVSATAAPAATSGSDGFDVTKAIIDGPDGAGFTVYQKIAQATVLMLEQIAEGASTIQINAHSRGAVEGIFVAHEFDRIKNIIKDNPDKTVDQIYELITHIDSRWGLVKMLWTHDSDTDNGVRDIYKSTYAQALKTLIAAFKEDSTAARELNQQSKLDSVKLKIFALDPVPGGTVAIRWEHSKFYYLPENVDCEVYYMAHERSGGFRAVILREGANIRRQLLPGNHASASGNFWRQSHGTSEPQVVFLGKKDGKEIFSATDDPTITDKREVILHHIQDLILIKLVESLRKSGVAVDTSQLVQNTAACRKIEDKYCSIQEIVTKVTERDLTLDERLDIYEQLKRDLPAYGLLCDGSGDAVYTYYQRRTGPREVRVRNALSDTTYQTGSLGVLFPVPKGYVNFEHLELKLEVLRKRLISDVDTPKSAGSASASSADENTVLGKITAIKKFIDKIVRTKLDDDDEEAFEGCKHWLGVYVDYTMATILKNDLSDETLATIFATFNDVLKLVSPDAIPVTSSQIAPRELKQKIKRFLQEKAYSLFQSRLLELEQIITDFDERITASVIVEGSVAGAVAPSTVFNDFEKLQFLTEQYYELCKRTTKFEQYRQQLASDGLDLITSESNAKYIEKFSEIKRALLEKIDGLWVKKSGIEYYEKSKGNIIADRIEREIQAEVFLKEEERKNSGIDGLTDEEKGKIRGVVTAKEEEITKEVAEEIVTVFKKINKIDRIEKISIAPLHHFMKDVEVVGDRSADPINGGIGLPPITFALWYQSFSRVAAEDLALKRLAHLERLEQDLVKKHEELSLRQSEIPVLNARIARIEKEAVDATEQLKADHRREKVSLCSTRDTLEERVKTLESQISTTAAHVAALEKQIEDLKNNIDIATAATAAAEVGRDTANAATAAALAASVVAEGQARNAQTATAEAQERVRALENERDAATAANAAAEEQVGVAQAATIAAVARAERAEAVTTAVVARAEAAEHELERYKTILKFTAFLTAGTTYGISKVFSLIPIQASVLTSFMSPAAAWESISQVFNFGAQPVDTTYAHVTDLEFCPVESVIDTLAKYPASVNTTTNVFGLLATTPIAVTEIFGTEALTCAAPVIATVVSTSGAVVAAPVTIAGICAAEALTCAAPFVADAAVASLETLMTVPVTYVAQALTYTTPAVVNTVASTSGALVAVPASVAATCAAEALTCAALFVADAAVASFGTLITGPVTYTAHAFTYAEPVVANTTATLIEALTTTMPTAVATNTSAGVCLAAEAAGVCAAELTASGAIFTSLLTPVAIATGLGGLAVLGAAAYYGYNYYKKSEHTKTVKTEEVVPEVTIAAPVGIIKLKKEVDVIEITPPIDTATTLPILQSSGKTGGKEHQSSRETTHCKVDADVNVDVIIPPSKIIRVTPWKLGIYTGFAVTAIVGSTLAVYFVAPLVAPIVMAYVATVQAAVMNFVLQYTFLIPVINALSSIGSYSSQLVVPMMNLLASFTNLLVNFVTANSVTNTVIGVKSLMLCVGSGLIVGSGTAMVAEVSSRAIEKLKK